MTPALVAFSVRAAMKTLAPWLYLIFEKQRFAYKGSPSIGSFGERSHHRKREDFLEVRKGFLWKNEHLGSLIEAGNLVPLALDTERDP